MTLVAVPLAAPSVAALLSAAKKAQTAGADVVELRLDLCAQQGASIREIIAAIPQFPLKVIATIRHADEQGAWRGDETERHDLLEAADRAGAAYVDVEFAHLGQLRQRITRARLIVSYHDFSGLGGDLSARVVAMRAAGCDIAKVVFQANDAANLALIYDLYQRHGNQPLIAVAMGEHGLASRLLAGIWGAYLTFARNEGDDGSAPGQPTVRDLISLYRLRQQNATTRIFGIIGSPVAHSLSPLIHNTALDHHQVNAVYVPFRCEDAHAFWDACGAWIDGLSITIPHKQSLVSRMAGVEDLVVQVGAMNTVFRNRDGRALGANTDALAVIACLEQALGTLSDRRVLVLGAGGVSRAIAFAVADRGAIVTIANRSLDKAQELAAEVGATAVTLDDAPNNNYDVLVNGTAVGMGEPDISPWPATAHRAGTVVFDTVYHPLETRLLRDAQSADARTICGLDMLINQALGQFKRWTGLDAPEHLMMRTALDRLTGTQA